MDLMALCIRMVEVETKEKPHANYCTHARPNFFRSLEKSQNDMDLKFDLFVLFGDGVVVAAVFVFSFEIRIITFNTSTSLSTAATIHQNRMKENTHSLYLRFGMNSATKKCRNKCVRVSLTHSLSLWHSACLSEYANKVKINRKSGIDKRIAQLLAVNEKLLVANCVYVLNCVSDLSSSLSLVYCIAVFLHFIRCL